jgi:hypothetical protein
MARILVVEEQQPNLTAMSKVMRGKGYGVVEAHSCNEARTLAVKNACDVLVVDVGLCEEAESKLITGRNDDCLRYRGRRAVWQCGAPGDPNLHFAGAGWRLHARDLITRRYQRADGVYCHRGIERQPITQSLGKRAALNFNLREVPLAVPPGVYHLVAHVIDASGKSFEEKMDARIVIGSAPASDELIHILFADHESPKLVFNG